MSESETPRVVTRKQQGSITVPGKGGKLSTVPVMLTIVDTYHADGRKDCTIKVPPLKTVSKGKS